MAQKKVAAKNDKGFEESLWDSANRLRGNVESSEYKHVVLSLIFLKFVSDKFEERRAELMAEGKEKYTDMVEFYTMKNVFYLPETSRWSYIQQHAKQDDIAIKIFTGQPIQQLHCLNMAAEYVQMTDEFEKRFMFLAKRLKAAYDICVGCDEFTQDERDHVHFYLAIRSIVFKLTKGDAPDLAQMNTKVQQMIAAALQSDGVEEIFKMGQGDSAEVDIFDPDYMAKIEKIKLPNTRIKLLQQLLAKAIDAFKKVNKLKGVDFSTQFKALVDRYNDRSEQDILRSEVLEEFTDEIIDLYHAIKKEKDSFSELGIDIEEKAFYDILKALTMKYDFEYPEDKLLDLAKKVKVVVDDKARYTDWSRRDDIKAELKVDLIILLAENGYPPVDRDEVYKEIFEQAENFKKHRSGTRA